PPPVPASLPLVFATRDSTARACVADAELLGDLTVSDALTSRSGPGDYVARAPAAASGPDADMLAAPRRWRRREMVRIAWRALAGWAEVEETLTELSDFADAAIRASVEHARGALTAR